eukprot:6177820-Pleurochrysis_carterae.AAC.1
MVGVYEKLGFPEAVCSIDGVHIHWESCTQHAVCCTYWQGRCALMTLSCACTRGNSTQTSSTTDCTTAKMQGLYALVDGGYHSWRCLMSPVKVA